MAKMLLVVNGADYSLPAVHKAVWLAKKEEAEVDILYVSPSCMQMYPEIPGLCFWMPEEEYKTGARQLMNRVLNEDILPALERAGLDHRLIISFREQDREIKRLSERSRYDKIFITGHSRYCTPENNGWLPIRRKPGEVPSGTVCLV